MCGFFGCFHYRNCPLTKESGIQAFESIKHRGPDAFGYKEINFDGKAIKFFHHRLSILDLRDVAAQPFASYNNRFLLIYNV